MPAQLIKLNAQKRALKRPNRLEKARSPRLFGACCHIAFGFVKDFRIGYVAAVYGVVLPYVIRAYHARKLDNLLFAVDE